MEQALRRLPPEQVRAALDAAAGRGMFFKFGDPAADPASWQPVSSLYSAGSRQLDELVEDARRSLAWCEPRVAVSVFFQGYAARLLSPPLACIAMRGCLPGIPAGQVRWRRETPALTLGLAAGEGQEGPAGPLITELVAASFGQHLLPLRDALLARVKLAEAVFTGNAASALVAGLRLLHGEFGPDWQALAASAVNHPYLRGSGAFAFPGTFARRSCCLIYQVPGHGTCGDCPVTPAQATRRT